MGSTSNDLSRRLGYFEDALALGFDVEPLVVAGYRLLELLGRGSFGHVFRARNPKLNLDVAIKLTRSRGAYDRDLAEARALAAVNHPHVVRVLAVDVVDGHVVTEMELVEGFRLDAWIAMRPGVDKVLTVLHQVGQGLAAIHRAGLAHRDIKPSNIVVDVNGNAKIVDLGLANTEPEHTGGLVGTKKWASPEAVEGGVVDHRSDQYSFGLVVRWALEEVGAIHLSNRFAGRATEPLPGARWRSISEGLDMLPHQHPRRWRALLAVAVLVGAVAGAFGVRMWPGGGEGSIVPAWVEPLAAMGAAASLADQGRHREAHDVVARARPELRSRSEMVAAATTAKVADALAGSADEAHEMAIAATVALWAAESYDERNAEKANEYRERAAAELAKLGMDGDSIAAVIGR